MSAITKIFGTHSERELKRIYPLVDKVASYREAMGALSDEELKNKTKEYKEVCRESLKEIKGIGLVGVRTVKDAMDYVMR